METEIQDSFVYDLMKFMMVHLDCLAMLQLPLKLLKILIVV